MENVDRVVREAGLRGWEDVYLVRSYHTDPMESLPALLEEINRRIPEHHPIWTAIGVKTLAGPEMIIEIEVEAARHDD
jgi:enamine deaminase RidA (YjgF/YER057c/UK114 family)